MNCPICARFCADGSRRCSSCGADFRDPDVMAMARAPTAPAAPAAASAIRKVGAGGLSIDKFLGMTGAGIADGTSLRRIGLIGAACLLVGFLVPIDLDFRGSEMPLAVLDKGPRAAILVPLILAIAGGLVALLKRGAVPPVAVAALLAVGGLAELALGLAPFGTAAGTATSLPILVWGGVSVAAIGISVRVLRPADPIAKWIVLAGTLLFIGGGLFTHSDAESLVPIEYRNLADGERLDGSFLGMSWDAVGDSMTLVLGGIVFLAALLLPVATLLAFRTPTGVWDRAGNSLRMIGTVIVLWLPLSFAVGVFNLFGWPGGPEADKVLNAFILGRTRLALLSLGATLWLTAGATALYISWRERTPRP